MMVSLDDQVKAYVKKIMGQLNKWIQKSKISKLVIVVTSKETGEHLERWQFDVRISALSTHATYWQRQVNVFNDDSKSKKKASAQEQENTAPEEGADTATTAAEKTEAEIQQEIQALFRQITASVTFLPMLDGNCTFNVLVYADADSDVPLEWGDSDAKEVKNAEKVQLRSFSTNSHRIDTLVSYR
jgi:mitotic spindle assembly checkpoint protein MAD2